jgi:hypothetical protein
MSIKVLATFFKFHAFYFKEQFDQQPKIRQLDFSLGFKENY